MKDLPIVSVEEGRALVLEEVSPLEIEIVDLIDAVGRVAAEDLVSDIDITPFAHAAMDGFAMKAAQLSHATSEDPIVLNVIAEIPAGFVYEGDLGEKECVRIMTGAPLPACTDSVVKYELVDYLDGDGHEGSSVAFTEPTQKRSNVREAGEEIARGEVAIRSGETIRAAGVGFLASCGITEVPVFRKPRVGIISLGSELVAPEIMPVAGQIRDGNSYALAACVKEAGGIPLCYPIVKDEKEAIRTAVFEAVKENDFVITSGGASNGDYDYIKDIIAEMGDLKMTLVNMRPGKAQAFGVIQEVPVLGLSGNPAAAFCGFELLIRPALRKMQGFSTFERPAVKAILDKDRKKKDARRLYLRATLKHGEDGRLHVLPFKNQNSGLFSTIQRGSCLAILPEGVPEGGRTEPGMEIDCILLDVDEGTVIA